MRKLKGKLREKGYTYERMAKKLGLSTTTLSYKINGKSAFLISEAAQIKLILNLSDQESVDIFLK